MSNPEPGTAREAVEATAKAVQSGNVALLMASITPEAMTQMMQMGAQAGGLSPATMPDIQGIEIGEETVDGEDHSFPVTFHSSAGNVSVDTTWRLLLGQWKIAGIQLISAEPAGQEA